MKGMHTHHKTNEKKKERNYTILPSDTVFGHRIRELQKWQSVSIYAD